MDEKTCLKCHHYQSWHKPRCEYSLETKKDTQISLCGCTAYQINEQITKQEKHKYRNSWFLKDLSDVSKSINYIGKQYRNNLLMHQRRRSSNPKLLVSLFYALYLTGSRVGELLRKPMLVRQMNSNGWVIMHCEKINEKHFEDYEQTGTTQRGRPIFTHTEGSEHKIITENIPVDNDDEKAMWDFIFEGGQYGTERKLDFSMLATYEQRTSITNSFKANFKADLSDGDHIYKQAGIAPHMLRHLRAYNLRFNKGYEESLVQSYMGWSNRDMFEHYLYILKQIKDEEQIRQVSRYLDAKEAKGDIKPKLTDLFAEPTI